MHSPLLHPGGTNPLRLRRLQHTVHRSAALLAALTFALCACSGARAQNTECFYDIANSNHAQGNLPPHYVGSASHHLAASALSAEAGLFLSAFSDQTGPGKFWFGGWATSSGAPGSPHLRFSVTTTRSSQPFDLQYTFFSGIWSGLWSGPPHLNVWASTDDFATATLIATHEITYTLPWENVASTFTDSLSALGTLPAGTTLQFRFVAWGEAPSNFNTPAGFSRLFPDDTNVVFRSQSTLEPPVITTQPADVVVETGASATLSVEATGPERTYQWYAGPSGSTVSPIGGATAPGFTTPGLFSTTAYWVRVTNADGSVDSNTATVTVLPPVGNTVVTYDIANSNHGQGALLPQYSGSTESYLMASTLSAQAGLYLSAFSDQTGPGKFWFGGWHVSSGAPAAPHLRFSITTTRTSLPLDLSYTFFSGIWSGLWSGPPHLNVWASTDDFATATLIATHDIAYTLPWENVSTTFTEKLAVLGPLPAGTTVQFRFVAWGEAPSNVNTPAGFSNLFPDDSNVIFRSHSVPAPPAIATQPAGTTVRAGETATFSVAASGAPTLIYRWTTSSDNGSTWSDVADGPGASGASTATLTLAAPTVAMNGERFRCVVTNPDGAVTSTSAPLTVFENYTAFAARWGLSGAQADMNAAPAGDGVSNLLKYALGLNPLESATTGLPVLDTLMEFSFNLPGAVEGVTYHVQTSPDLATWTTLQSWPATPAPGSQTIGVTIPAVAPHLFVRLKVTAP